ncbi:MAG: tubulin-like doman-containing protein [Lachnospiraceae bacterium]
MALTAEEKKRLDKLAFANGGGYSDFLTGVQKQNPSSDKFLFIGLGGKGCSTVAHLKTEVYKKIECPTGKIKPNNFEYLAIDTDDNSLNQLCHSGLGRSGFK